MTPRASLTRTRVLQAALTLADDSGIDALTMRRLGESLGVQAMSLYNHVRNKEDILDGLVELVAEKFEVPAPGMSWRVALFRRATSVHTVLLEHPWACELLMSRPNVGPAMLRYVDATIGCLRHAGFSIAEADHAWNAIDSYTYGFTMQQQKFPFAPEDYANVAASYLPQLEEEGDHPHLLEMTRAVANREHEGIHDFTVGLDWILDGLERALER